MPGKMVVQVAEGTVGVVGTVGTVGMVGTVGIVTFVLGIWIYCWVKLGMISGTEIC